MCLFDPDLPEAWYPVPGFPAYELSSRLRARSNHREPRIVKIAFDGRYKKLILWKDKKYHNVYLHRVVAFLAHGPCPDGQEVRHLDDDKSNNWPSNLAYGTPCQNADDCERNGHRAKGERCGRAKLSENLAKEAYRLSVAGVPDTEIARGLQIHPATVHKIRIKQTWKHLHNNLSIEEKVSPERTQCKRGHAINKDNAYLVRNDFWQCRICLRDNSKKHRLRRKMAKTAA